VLTLLFISSFKDKKEGALCANLHVGQRGIPQTKKRLRGKNKKETIEESQA